MGLCLSKVLEGTLVPDRIAIRHQDVSPPWWCPSEETPLRFAVSFPAACHIYEVVGEKKIQMGESP